jgi:hypothetical protein
MATLTFTAGPITSGISASNTKAQRIVNAHVKVSPGEGVDFAGMTNQQVADRFMVLLRQFVVNGAKLVLADEAKERALAEAAAEIESDPPEWEN